MNNQVWAIDFKTNAAVPENESDVPLGILRQMGAYQSALEQVFPNHLVKTSIVWTANASLMDVSHDIVREALSSTPTS